MSRNHGVSVYWWGGRCPNHLLFNDYNYKKGKCSRWQNRFWQSWHSHGEKGLVSDEFLDFAVAYDWLVNDYPLFDQFVAHCDDATGWNWEKDGSTSHVFDSGIQYVPRDINIKQLYHDNPDLGSQHATRLSAPEIRQKAVSSRLKNNGSFFNDEAYEKSRLAHEQKSGHSSNIYVDGVLYSSSDVASRETGLSAPSIRKCARLRLGSWKDKKGVVHTASYEWYK